MLRLWQARRSKSVRVVLAVSAAVLFIKLALVLSPYVILSGPDHNIGSVQTAKRPVETVTLRAPVQMDDRLSVKRLEEQQHENESLADQPATTDEGSPALSREQTPVTEFNPELAEECHWVRRTKTSPPYFLTAVILVRIYDTDKAKLTSRELKQWLEYVRYAGVEHVYFYDVFEDPSESQKEVLEEFFKDEFITYIDWSAYTPYGLYHTQIPGYQNCLDTFGQESTWQTAIDMDEYPFSPSDTEPGFLTRFLEQFDARNRDLSEVSMQNYLFLGKPLERELFFDRYHRRTPKCSNNLVKPIYKPLNVRASIHHNKMKKGISRNAPDNELRMNHYWGARLQDWGEDTPEILAKTIEDHSMEPIVDAFKRCEAFLRPYLD